jgi:serine/threonine protein kinase
MIPGYTIVKKLNKGTYAKIKLAICDADGREVAIKIIKKPDSEKKLIVREVTMLRCLNHPHIVKYIDMLEDEHSYYIVMEYVKGKQLFDKVLYLDTPETTSSSTDLAVVPEEEGTDLDELAKSARGVFSMSNDGDCIGDAALSRGDGEKEEREEENGEESDSSPYPELEPKEDIDLGCTIKESWLDFALHKNDSLSVLTTATVKRYFSQIISAMGHCHAKFIAHRDLKLENILVDSEDKIKIIDFGFADFVRSGRKTFCGSMYYIAPEIINGDEEYSSIKSDIWSLGIVLYAMLSGRLPFGGKNDKEISRRIVEQKLVLPEYMPADVSDLLMRMLRKNPEKRITLSGIREHIWLRNHTLPLYLPEEQKKIRLIDNNVVDRMVKMGYSDLDVFTAIRKGQNNECLAVYRALCEKYSVDAIAKDMVDKLNEKDSPDLPRKVSKDKVKTSPMIGRFFKSRRTSLE